MLFVLPWSYPSYKNKCPEMSGQSWHASGQTVRVPVHEPEQICYGRLGHLGDSEWRTEADHRVHRERNHDGTVFSSSDVDIRREDWKRLEEDTVAKR